MVETREPAWLVFLCEITVVAQVLARYRLIAMSQDGWDVYRLDNSTISVEDRLCGGVWQELASVRLGKVASRLSLNGKSYAVVG